MKSLMTAVEAAVKGQCTSVTGLGRASARPVTEKASIKQMDRLVGNARMQADAPHVYRAMTYWLVGQVGRPVILVDWSPIADDEGYHVLRASVPVGGQGRTVYQRCHPQKLYANPEVQAEFLSKLQEILPPGSVPIVVTDAGFKKPWFRAVSALGWDWVGRIRGNTKLTRPGETVWLDCQQLGLLLEQDTPCYLGSFIMTRRESLPCQVYGLRKPPKGRVHKTRGGQRAQDSKSREHAVGAREPWLLVTSLTGGQDSLALVLRLYTQRMQIEEDFRATKSRHYGLGVERSRSRSAARFEVLLLIAALASFVAWLMGMAAELQGLHRQYQSNSCSKRRWLS
ncbi:IS4 family transposase, partial [Ectothiorhodospira lacustris]